MSGEQQGEEGHYFLENDDEVQRLETQHEFWKYYLDGKLLMPGIEEDLAKKENVEVLDSGTADGLWLRDVSTTLPKAKFVGTDITTFFFPPNSDKISYKVQDILKPWDSSLQNRFDLAHSRIVLASAMGVTDLKANLAAFAETVKPGGWIQLQEIDDDAVPKTNGPAMTTFLGIIKGFSPEGDPSFMNRVKGILEELGFENVQEKIIYGGFGAACENKELGLKQGRGSVAAVKGVAAALKGKGLMPDDVLESLPDRYEKEMDTQGGILPCKIVWGKKRA